VAASLPDFIRRRVERAGVLLDSAALSALATYLGLLTKWNVTVNLTALSLNPASDEAIDRLLIEPLLAAASVRSGSLLVGNQTAVRLLDVGSGGGSPAIPLAIGLGSRAPIALHMVESKTRKAAFLRDAIRQVPLAGGHVFNCRLEDLLAKPELHQAFDLASIRAVRADSDLWLALSGLVRAGGLVLWFRTPAEVTSSFPDSYELERVTSLVAGSELVHLRRLGSR
jgi:16S rRNA G527 N7-methylase RsmG